MSSCPGTTLEAFLMWNFDLIVDGDDSANKSLQIGERAGMRPRRKELSTEQFAPIVAIFEPHREAVESRLCNFTEEDCGSWRDYAGLAFDFLPGVLFEAAAAKLPVVS